MFRNSAQGNVAFDPEYEARVERDLQEQEERFSRHANVDLARLD